MIHGKEETRKIKVGNGAIYTKRVKYCAAHGWIDLVACGGASAWHARHDRCASIEQPAAASLKLSPLKAAARG